MLRIGFGRLTVGTRSVSPTPSHPPHPAIERLLLAGLVEQDCQLVALDRDHVAVAEFLMEHALAACDLGGRAGRFGDQLALDGERAGATGAGKAAHALDSGAVSRAGWVIARDVLVILTLVLLKPLGPVVRFCARCQPGVP